MNDRLEDFVRDHRNDFDCIEPDVDLWQGIQNKMEGKRKHRIGFYASRVAAVAAIFIVSFIVQRFVFNEHNTTKNIPELVEAENYYTGLISAKLEEVKPMLTEFPEIKSELDSDLSELDKVYSSLREDLKDNVANQEVVEAMIENYRLRIDILEEMLHFLDRQNSDKNNHNNKQEYEL